MAVPTLTLDGFARGLGAPLDAVAPLWATVEPHLATMAERPQDTVRPPVFRSDESVLRRLNDEAPSLVFEDELGRGGMGVVRLATQTAVGRKVAVKSLRAGADTEGGASSLLHEAWITGAVEHPNIVPLYDVEVDETGQPLVVLRRIEGTSWRALVEDPEAVRTRFGVTDALEWHVRTLMQVCSAVHYAHGCGILHRDVKPDNVMVGGPGEVYLVDWGIARAYRPVGDGRLPRLDVTEGMAGTPAYMAPEMLGAPGSRLGPATDVYLLGATLYHILAGKPPHQGQSVLQIMLNVLKGAPPPPGPAELVATCERAMAVEPEARFASAEALRQALQHYLEHREASRLAEDADARLTTLEASLTEGLEATERQRLFGECRFGFSRALESWPECALAQRGLRRALTLMIEQAVAEEHADAAAALLAELRDPPEALQTLVAEAQAAARARVVRLERLERIQREFDPRVGTRARIVVFGAVMLLLMLRPAAWLLGRGTYGAEAWIWPAILLGVAGTGLVIARRSLWSTALNRRISGMLLTTLVAYGGLSFGLALRNVPYLERSQFGLHFGASIIGMFAIAVDLRAMVAASTYFIGYLASVAGLINPHLSILIGHAVLGLCIVFIGRRAAHEGSFLQVERAALLDRVTKQ